MFDSTESCAYPRKKSLSPGRARTTHTHANTHHINQKARAMCEKYESLWSMAGPTSERLSGCQFFQREIFKEIGKSYFKIHKIPWCLNNLIKIESTGCLSQRDIKRSKKIKQTNKKEFHSLQNHTLYIIPEEKKNRNVTTSLERGYPCLQLDHRSPLILNWIFRAKVQVYSLVTTTTMKKQVGLLT